MTTPQTPPRPTEPRAAPAPKIDAPPVETAPSESNPLVQELKAAFSISLRMFKMEREAYVEAAEQTSLRVAGIMFGGSMLIFLLGSLPHWRMGLARPIFLVAMLGIVHLVAKAQNGKGELVTLFRVMSHFFVLEALAIIPSVGGLLFVVATAFYLWMLTAVLQELYGLDQHTSVRSVLASAGAALLLGVVFVLVEGAVRGASKEDSLAPGALNPGRNINEINP